MKSTSIKKPSGNKRPSPRTLIGGKLLSENPQDHRFDLRLPRGDEERKTRFSKLSENWSLGIPKITKTKLLKNQGKLKI